MRKIFILYLMTIVLLWLLSASSVFAEIFNKYGNDGTASCSDFCASGIKWPTSNDSGGAIGSCVSAKITAKNEIIGCNDIPGHLDKGQLACTCEDGLLPISASSEDTVGRDWYMKTNITFSDDGRIDGRTETTSCKRWGFTGGVSVVLLDKDANILHKTKMNSYGVNGQGWDKRCDVRSDHWSAGVSTDIASKVGGIIIYHTHKPEHNITKEDLYEYVEKGAKIYTAIRSNQ